MSLWSSSLAVGMIESLRGLRGFLTILARRRMQQKNAGAAIACFL